MNSGMVQSVFANLVSLRRQQFLHSSRLPRRRDGSVRWMVQGLTFVVRSSFFCFWLRYTIGCWRNREQDDCEPNTPSHKPVPEVIKKKMASRQVPVWSSKHHTREQDSAFCPDSLSACPIPSLQGGYECVDTTQELENCGGCTVDGAGMDCTSIAGVSGVGCLSGQCVVFSCTEGYRLSSAGACVPSLLGRSA